MGDGQAEWSFGAEGRGKCAVAGAVAFAQLAAFPGAASADCTDVGAGRFQPRGGGALRGKRADGQLVASALSGTGPRRPARRTASRPAPQPRLRTGRGTAL